MHSMNSLADRFDNWTESLQETNKTQGNKIIQFFTGACWFIILAAWIPFMKTFKRKRDKISAFFLMILLAVVAGGLSCLLPVIVSPIVNYIGVPFIQLAIVVIIAVRNDKK